jgi:DNA processing protein
MAFPMAQNGGSAPLTKLEIEVGSDDPGYPTRLRGTPAAPKSLWFRGRLPAAGERVFAVVGARAATASGCDRSRAIAFGLGGAGAAIISGGAFGIDAAAHEGAMAAGAVTFAVLGCGTDVIYPDRHADLFARVAASGGLLSEYRPGTPPRAGQFPARNRIIAGLADGVIVVEAALRSGALITARLGRELGRPLFAVPGSPGTDALLRAGHAFPAASAVEITNARLDTAPPALAPTRDCGRLTAIVDAISAGVETPSDLCKRTGMALPAVLAILAEAELEGFVKRAAGNTYEVNELAR